MAKRKAFKTKVSQKPVRPKPRAKTIHTITIGYAGGVLTYAIDPPQSDAKKARVKRGDVVKWISRDGDWTVTFKHLTPLEDDDGIGIAALHATSGNSAEGNVAKKPKDNTEFPYGVVLVLNNQGGTVKEDPEIIVDGDAVIIGGPKPKVSRPVT